MKRLLLFFIILFIHQISNAQYLIIGDTTNFQITTIEETFYPDSEVSFDMDCDGVGDLRFQSYLIEGNPPIGNCPNYGGINVFHHNSLFIKLDTMNGNFDTLQYGDTLSQNTIGWAARHYLYYGCIMGWPGLYSSNNAYFAFFKAENNDTSYLQIKFSHVGEIFTIHKVYSTCSTPFKIIKNTINISDKIIIYPNPFKNNFTINMEDIKQVNLYDNTGNLVHQSFNTNRIQNLDFLSIGIYFIEIIDIYDNRTIDKILKIDDF